LDQTKAAVAASRDAELLSRPFSLDDLTEDHAAELEQAARRQLDRAKAGVEKQRTFVDAGIARTSRWAQPPWRGPARRPLDPGGRRAGPGHPGGEMAALVPGAEGHPL